MQILNQKREVERFLLPRQIAMYLSRNRTESSFPEIGEAFGGKGSHHSYACGKKDRKRNTKDVDIKSNIEAIERKLDQMG